MIIQRMLRSFYSDEPTDSSDGSRSPFRLRLNAMDDLLEDAPPIRIDFDTELDVSCVFYFCYSVGSSWDVTKESPSKKFRKLTGKDL